jgi:hypothetical protein
MKKYLSILIFIIFCNCQTGAQEVIADIAKKYYRSNPFEIEFSKFLTHLMNDPTLINKTTLKKTDTSLFFFEGTYTSHNPFFFQTNRSKIILAEREEIETGTDSSQYLQTVFLYQLIAYAPPGEEGIKDVREQFDKFCRRYKKKFAGDNYKELKTEGKQVGEITDYSLEYPGFFPLAVAWATSKKNTDNIFALTIRFRVFNNQAYLPTAPDGF